MIIAAVLAAAVGTAVPADTAAAQPRGPWILTCDVGAGGGAPAQRTFRLGERLLQEWSEADRQFGPNLCESFSCTRTPGRLEGQIASTTVGLTLSLDLATQRAAWRTVGASGLGKTSGACAVTPDRTPAAPPAGAPR